MKLTTLYEGSLFDCQVIKDMLDNEGISSVLKDEVVGTRAHVWIPTSTVKVEINEQDLLKASKVLEAFEKRNQTD